ncbi:winged helix-turn-helix domain-containing protein [Enterococcus sp. 669A]|uniref:Winged helix-turn-helix domain-containing protein n=1 Tax=Candidatus Enterococcus moelleringii TaxID=2815325 RepID=A0ABS3LA32_9ENTE|nr:helix-turn-helix domain-containing protein [Enterococcus sp. 669A]MBO1306467.1 winged helix-turn-helix domain-containing protein [Enterococcus sp. 669A]
MRPILILTKNLLTERWLQEQLQLLNYEVFCSVTMLKHLQLNPNRPKMIENYQAIIFSETLTNQEIRELQDSVDHENNLLVRKFNEEPTIKEKEVLADLAIDTWIYEDQSLDILRELLATRLSRCQSRTLNNVFFLYQKDDSPKSLMEFKSGLTKKERLAFECLMESETGQVSRDGLCHYIWKGDSNNSRLTQISVLIKRLKYKLEEAGFQNGMIETVWGYGYKLSPKLVQFYSQEAMQ